jgi:RecA-family ATPase
VETTGLYKQLYEACGDIKPINTSIDTLSRAFAGQEIERNQVYQFASHMQALALIAEGTTTILSHPSLGGMASGSGISGSTAWHGAFRFRQYLKSVRDDDSGGDQPSTDLRQLEFKKNQYGPLSEPILLQYRSGLFLPQGGASSLERAARELKVDDVFMAAVRKLHGQGVDLSPQPTSHAYAPTIISRLAEAKGVGKSELAAAMQRLFNGNRLQAERVGRTGREKTVLRAKPHLAAVV